MDSSSIQSKPLIIHNINNQHQNQIFIERSQSSSHSYLDLIPQQPLPKQKLTWGARRKWCGKYQLITITYPIVNDKKTNTSKRFVVKFIFRDQKKGQHIKTVFFGQEKKQQFIDHHDELKKQKTRFRYIHGDDLFQPAFWRHHLLNNKQTIEQSFIELVKYLKINKS